MTSLIVCAGFLRISTANSHYSLEKKCKKNYLFIFIRGKKR